MRLTQRPKPEMQARQPDLACFLPCDGTPWGRPSLSKVSNKLNGFWEQG